MTGGYGYDAYAGGYGASYGGYSSPPPGGYLDAAAYLYGPGSHAYLSYTSSFGETDTSYASEGSNGGLIEVGTTTFHDGTRSTLATYHYSGGGYRYDRSVDTFSPSHPVQPAYGYGYYGTNSAIPDHLETYSYSSFQVVSHQANGYTYSDQQNFGVTFYSDGSSVSHYTDTSRELTSDGHTVPGTIQSYSVSGFDYGSGYTVYVPG